MTFTASFAEPTQDFPATLAAVQGYFPGALAGLTQGLLFQTAGAIADDISAVGSLNVTGTVHGGLPSTAIQKNCASIRRGATDGYLASNASLLDAAAGADFSFLCWVMWDPDASGALCYVVDKMSGGNVGWQLKTDPSSYNITATVRDGVQAALNATTTTGTIFSGNSYQMGAWLPIMVTWNAATGVLKLYTNRETITSTNAAMVSLSNAVAATVGNAQANNLPFHGSIAYALHMVGYVATQADFDGYVKYGTMTGTNLSRATPAKDGFVTMDSRDATFGLKCVVRDVTQPPYDQRYGKNGMLFENQTLNNLYATEEIGDGVYWTNDAGINVTRDYGVAPRQGSFSTTRIQKLASGALKYTKSSNYSLFTNNIAGAVMARGTGKITLRLTASTGTPTDQTQSFTLTSAWQIFVLTSTVNNQACVGNLFIAAGDVNDLTALADMEVWGARINSTTDGIQYYPCHAVNNQSGAATNVVTGLDVAPRPNGAAFIEVAFVPTKAPSTTALWYCTAAGADGGIKIFPNGSIRCIEADLTNALAEVEPTTYWDMNKSWLTNTRTHLVETYDVATQTAQTYVNSAGCLPLQTLSGGVSTLPPTLTAAFTLGKNDSTSAQCDCVIEVLAIGPTYLNCAQVQARSTLAGVTPVQRICHMGDSITGFYDGYHVELNTRLGVGDGLAVCANFGLSGNTTDQMLARFDENVHTDSQGAARNWTSVGILGGINDLLFFGQNAQHVINNLTTMRDRALGWGLKVFFLTIMPCRGRVEWTPTIQGYIDTVNAWIAQQTNVADAYGLLQVTTTGTFNGQHAGNTNGTGPGYFGGVAGGGVQNGAGTQTYDELHPTGSGADVAQTPVQNTGAQRGSDAVGDLTYAIFPLQATPTTTVTTPVQVGGGGAWDDRPARNWQYDAEGRVYFVEHDPPRNHVDVSIGFDAEIVVSELVDDASAGAVLPTSTGYLMGVDLDAVSYRGRKV